MDVHGHQPELNLLVEGCRRLGRYPKRTEALTVPCAAQLKIYSASCACIMTLHVKTVIPHLNKNARQSRRWAQDLGLRFCVVDASMDS